MKYPLALYFLTLAILLSVTLADWRYLVGTDIHLSAYFAQEAARFGWQPAIAHPGNSALGDVLLAPAFGIWFTFKILLPVLFAFVPVVLYHIYLRFLKPLEAFLAAVFFISVPTVTMELAAIPRQMLAEFFLALFLYVLLAVQKLKVKLPVLVLLGGAVIVSHYSIGIVLILIMLAYFVILAALRILKQKSVMPLWATGCLSLVLLAGGVGYYANVAGGTPLRYMTAIAPIKVKIGSMTIGYAIKYQEVMAKEQAEQAGETEQNAVHVKLLTGGNLVGLAESYDNVMRAALGLDFLKASVLGKIYRVIQFITFALLIIGVGYSLFKRKMRDLLKPEYLALILISCGILGLCVLSPGFASILNGTRWYHISLFALAPMLVIGMKVIMRRVNVSVY